MELLITGKQDTCASKKRTICDFSESFFRETYLKGSCMKRVGLRSGKLIDANLLHLSKSRNVSATNEPSTGIYPSRITHVQSIFGEALHEVQKRILVCHASVNQVWGARDLYFGGSILIS